MPCKPPNSTMYTSIIQTISNRPVALTTIE